MDDCENDEILMERASRGDTTAFDEIVRRHQHRLQRFATRMLGGDAVSGADITVGAFLRLWEKRGVFRTTGKLSAWLLRTSHRLCLDSLRQSRPTGELADERMGAFAADEGAHARLERTILADAVRDAVMELPETHRAVLVLSIYEGMTYDEIGEVLEIPPGTVASRKNHALTILRRRLTAWS